MISANITSSISDDAHSDETLFELIAQGIEKQGYTIQPTALPHDLSHTLFMHQRTMETVKFKTAGIGRGDEFLKNEFIRTDEICWIAGNTEAGKLWLDWITRLQSFLNRRLYLGLFSFESHFSHYRPGDYYKRHYDAFRGEANRVLSIVAYFNPNWTSSDGGELILYKDDQDKTGIKVSPIIGTVVAFLSEEFPHEVLPTNRDRHSIAGWFRVNTSTQTKVDPPL